MCIRDRRIVDGSDGNGNGGHVAIQSTIVGLESEGETESNEFTLKLNTCLGACPHAPVMSYDHHLAGNMNIERAVSHLQPLTDRESA